METYSVKIARTGAAVADIHVLASSRDEARDAAKKIGSSKLASGLFRAAMNATIVRASVEVAKPGVLLTPFIDPDKPTDNSDRAKRIDMIQILYGQIMGEEADESCRSATSLACILADMRHWCVEHGVDFSDALSTSDSHFAEEQE